MHAVPMDADEDLIKTIIMDQIIWLSVITASVAFTFTETRLLLPFREWVCKRSKFFGKLVKCGYCTGHWVAFILTTIYKPRLFYCCALLDYFLTALAIAWLGALQWILCAGLWKKQENEIEQQLSSCLGL